MAVSRASCLIKSTGVGFLLLVSFSPNEKEVAEEFVCEEVFKNLVTFFLF